MQDPRAEPEAQDRHTSTGELHPRKRTARRSLVMRCLIAALSLWIVGCDALDRREIPWIARGRRGIVACDSAYASKVGVEILRQGGNAVDAAAAVSFALGVVRPYSTGLGGGGFMIVRLADGRTTVLDYRETAPAASTRGMFASPGPGGLSASEIGFNAVATPGLLAGQAHALRRFGTMSLARTLQPAIRLARDGFDVDPHYLDGARAINAKFLAHPELALCFAYLRQTHLAADILSGERRRIRQPALADLMEAIAESGPDFFYRGPVARAIDRESKRHGGVIRAADLAAYRVKERVPLHGRYRSYEIIAMPPPSSGGIALIEALNILEHFDLPTMSKTDPAAYAHLRIEAMKHAFADRARWLGDADFAPVPVEALISKNHARSLAAAISLEQTADLESYGLRALPDQAAPPSVAPGQQPDDAGTSHYCIVDRWGNIVVATETINTTFGSLAAIDEWGLILNNEMDDFAANPGVPNAYGLVQSDRNAAEAGKRPLSSMSPTIVLENGRPILALGASGGPRIITSVLSVLLGVTDGGLTLEDAILATRPHHQWLPNAVFFDERPSDELREALTARGHRIDNRPRKATVQAVMKTRHGWLGASDPRKGGRPAGY